MASSNAGPITGGELIRAVQDGQTVYLTRPQVASLLAFTALTSPRASSFLTERTGDENFRAVQGTARIEMNAADMLTYLAGTATPQEVPRDRQPAAFTGREKLVVRQGAMQVPIDLSQVLYVRGLGGSLGGVTGPGGGTPTPTPTPGPSDFTMSQLADANRIYQRSTLTGGGQSKGRGVIPVTLSVTTPGNVYARVRAQDNAILQSSWVAATTSAAGSQVVQIANVDARLGWFYLDLSVDGSVWQQGTTLIGMGSLTAVSGQSLATRMFLARDSQATVTIASTGVTIPANAACFAQALEPSATAAPLPSWGLIAEGSSGPYNSAFAAEYLGKRIAATGVNCGLIGYARGAASITRFIPGGADNAGLRAALDAAGGFETFIWMQGHTDARDGMSGATYQGHLTTLFNDMTARNAIRGSNYDKLLGSIPNISSTAWGAPAQILAIRNAVASWVLANGGSRINAQDINLYDNVHQSQIGSVTLADHFYRASRPGLGLAGDDTGPSLASGSRAAGAVDIVLPVSYPTGASAMSGVGSPASRFSVFNTGTMTSALALDSTTPITIGASSITLKLASAPADSQALDVYAFAPIDAAGADANAIYDNHTDGDGITRGRQLMATVAPIDVAAPGGGGTPTPTPVGPNLTMTSPTYQTGKSGFGQELAGGYGFSPANTDLLSSLTTATIECVFMIAAAPSAAKVMIGQAGRAWLGVNAQGRLIGAYNSGASSTAYAGGSSPSTAGSNPVVTDGVRHHAALVLTGSTGKLFLDGVQVAQLGTAWFTQSGTDKFGVANFSSANTTFLWPGTVDEVAVFNTERYTANFTPSTTPYVGNEAGLIGLYHLDGSGNAATVG